MNGREPNTLLMHAIRRISRWIDKRRPRNVSLQERASLYQHPEYLEAVWRREDQAEICRRNPSPRNRSRLDRLVQDVNKTFNRLLRALKKEVRKAFDRKQAVIDIERQLSGTAVHDEEAKEILRTEVKMPPEQIRLLEKLFTWPTSHWGTSGDDGMRPRRQSSTIAPFLKGAPSEDGPSGLRQVMGLMTARQPPTSAGPVKSPSPMCILLPAARFRMPKCISERQRSRKGASSASEIARCRSTVVFRGGQSTSRH